MVAMDSQALPGKAQGDIRSQHGLHRAALTSSTLKPQGGLKRTRMARQSNLESLPGRGRFRKTVRLVGLQPPGTAVLQVG